MLCQHASDAHLGCWSATNLPVLGSHGRTIRVWYGESLNPLCPAPSQGRRTHVVPYVEPGLAHRGTQRIARTPQLTIEDVKFICGVTEPCKRHSPGGHLAQSQPCTQRHCRAQPSPCISGTGTDPNCGPAVGDMGPQALQTYVDEPPLPTLHPSPWCWSLDVGAPRSQGTMCHPPYIGK